MDSPLGFKDRYTLNDWSLMGAGDILTDGLTEHRHGEQDYFPNHVEQTVQRVKDRSARAIYEAVREDLVAFGEPADDISLVVHQTYAARMSARRPVIAQPLTSL